MSCNQALYEEVLDKMKKLGIRGYTGWEEVAGCGSRDGEPHLGDYAWPTLNSAFISIVEDSQCDEFMRAISEIDKENEKLGIRAFWWEVGGTV